MKHLRTPKITGLLLALALALGLSPLLSGCATQGAAAGSTPTPIPTPIVPQKPTYTVQKGSVSKILELRGRVSAVRQQELFFRTNGVVDSVLVERGDTVTEGQVLAFMAERDSYEAAVADADLALLQAQDSHNTLLDEAGLKSAEALVAMLEAEAKMIKAQQDRDLLDRPRANQTMLDNARAQLALAEEALAIAREEYAQVEKLQASDPLRASALMNLNSAQRGRDDALATLNWYLGHSSPRQIAEADATLLLAQATYSMAQRKYERIKDGPDTFEVALSEAGVRKAEAALEKARSNLASLTITAPFSGQVFALSLTPGAQVTAFKSVATLVDPDSLEITLLPSSSELADISVGQLATVRLASRPAQELPASVRQAPMLAASTSGQPTDQTVRVALTDPGAALTLGEAATVTIKLEERAGTLWIAPAALRTFQGRDFVIILDGEVQRRVDVRLGLKSPDRIEILEGLSAGQVAIGP